MATMPTPEPSHGFRGLHPVPKQLREYGRGRTAWNNRFNIACAMSWDN